MFFVPLSVVYNEFGKLAFIRVVDSEGIIEDYSLDVCLEKKIIMWADKDSFIFMNTFAVTELQLDNNGEVSFVTDELMQFFIDRQNNTGIKPKMMVFNSIGDSEEVSDIDVLTELASGNLVIGNPSYKLCDYTGKMQREDLCTRYHLELKHNKHEILFHPEYKLLLNRADSDDRMHRVCAQSGKQEPFFKLDGSDGYFIGTCICDILGDIIGNL